MRLLRLDRLILIKDRLPNPDNYPRSTISYPVMEAQAEYMIPTSTFFRVEIERKVITSNGQQALAWVYGDIILKEGIWSHVTSSPIKD